MHDYRGVIVPIHVTQWHWFPCVYDMHQHAWYFEGLSLSQYSLLIRIVHTDTKPCRCAILNQTRNFAGFSSWKWGPLLPYSSSKSLVKIAFCVLWCTYGKALKDFRHENKVKCCWIFVEEIQHRWQTVGVCKKPMNRKNRLKPTELLPNFRFGFGSIRVRFWIFKVENI